MEFYSNCFKKAMGPQTCYYTLGIYEHNFCYQNFEFKIKPWFTQVLLLNTEEGGKL